MNTADDEDLNVATSSDSNHPFSIGPFSGRKPRPHQMIDVEEGRSAGAAAEARELTVSDPQAGVLAELDELQKRLRELLAAEASEASAQGIASCSMYLQFCNKDTNNLGY